MTFPSFQHVSPPLRLFQGSKCLEQLSSELARLNIRRAVIFCGSSLEREGTALALVRQAMGERCAGVFAGVRAHSPLASVETASQELKRLEADAVVAVGGGSAIVSARAASILLAEKGDARALCTTVDDSGRLQSPRLMAAKLPQLVIPTTPTTACVKAGSAVFDPVSGKRLALFDPKTRAQAIFIHPELLKTAPGALVASASLSTFVLALEGLMSRTGDPLSDAALMHSLRLMANHLADPEALQDPGARADLVVAAVLCGQGTDHTGAGIMTVLGHAIGARHGIENGIANVIVLPAVLGFNADAATKGLEKVAASLNLGAFGGARDISLVVDGIQSILRPLDIPGRLRDVGVPHESLAGIADIAMGDWFLRGNPRAVQSAAELQAILEASW